MSEYKIKIIYKPLNGPFPNIELNERDFAQAGGCCDSGLYIIIFRNLGSSKEAKPEGS